MTIQELIDALREIPGSARHLPVYAFDPETGRHVPLLAPTRYDQAEPYAPWNPVSMTLGEI